jgi:hypothetical protein
MYKLFESIKRSAIEQARSFWVLLMALTIAPFFVLVYYLIAQDSEYHCKILVVNHDKGVLSRQNDSIVYSDSIVKSMVANYNFITVAYTQALEDAQNQIEDKKYHLALFFPDDYSQKITQYKPSISKINIELYGDRANFDYLMGGGLGLRINKTICKSSY